ncbi:DNA polymerase III subunit delta, partial [Bacillus pumilus]
TDAEPFLFMGERRHAVIKNPYFITAEKKKEKIEHELSVLEAYLEQQADYTILVLLDQCEKLDERKKITKLLQKNAAMVEAKELHPKDTTDFTFPLVKTE